MVLSALLNIIKTLIEFLFGWINLPSLPESFTDSLDTFMDILFSNASVIGFFIRPSTLVTIIPIVIILINFRRIYEFTMFILRKLPFININ